MTSIVFRAITILLLLLATRELPYDYYTILRLVVCGVSAYVCYRSYINKDEVWSWIFGIIAFLFNPIAPIYLGKRTWVVIDLLVAGIFFVSIFVLKLEGEKSSGSG